MNSLILGQAILNLLISWVHECLSEAPMIKSTTLRRMACLLRELSLLYRVSCRTSFLRANTHRSGTAELIWELCCVVPVVKRCNNLLVVLFAVFRDGLLKTVNKIYVVELGLELLSEGRNIVFDDRVGHEMWL